jgi:hypothetical protein
MALRPRRAWREQEARRVTTREDEERGWRRVERMAQEIYCPAGVGFNGLRRSRHARHACREEISALELWRFCCAETVWGDDQGVDWTGPHGRDRPSQAPHTPGSTKWGGYRDGQTGRPVRPGPGPVKPGQKPGRACCASGLNFLSKPGPQRA